MINALRDGHRNFSVLSSALQLLSLTGVDVTDALVSLMGYDDADLRIQAALALGTQRRPEAVEALIAAFDDPDANVRFHAIEAIGRHGHAAAIDRLIAIATSGDFFLAFPAIEALVRIDDPLVAPRLSRSCWTIRCWRAPRRRARPHWRRGRGCGPRAGAGACTYARSMRLSARSRTFTSATRHCSAALRRSKTRAPDDFRRTAHGADSRRAAARVW